MLVKLEDIRCPKCYSENYVLPNKEGNKDNDYYCFACDHHFHAKQAYIVKSEYFIKV